MLRIPRQDRVEPERKNGSAGPASLDYRSAGDDASPSPPGPSADEEPLFVSPRANRRALRVLFVELPIRMILEALVVYVIPAAIVLWSLRACR